MSDYPINRELKNENRVTKCTVICSEGRGQLHNLWILTAGMQYNTCCEVFGYVKCGYYTQFFIWQPREVFNEVHASGETRLTV